MRYYYIFMEIQICFNINVEIIQGGNVVLLIEYTPTNFHMIFLYIIVTFLTEFLQRHVPGKGYVNNNFLIFIFIYDVHNNIMMKSNIAQQK